MFEYLTVDAGDGNWSVGGSLGLILARLEDRSDKLHPPVFGDYV